MGYNHAAAFIAAPAGDYIKPFKPWFEGPVVGPTKAVKPTPLKQFLFPAINMGESHAALLDLRARWLNAFITSVHGLNPEIPRDVAVEWVNLHFPKTADDLAMSMTFGQPQKLAFRLADAWEAA